MIVIYKWLLISVSSIAPAQQKTTQIYIYPIECTIIHLAIVKLICLKNLIYFQNTVHQIKLLWMHF